MASGDLQERIETVLSEHRLNVSDEWCTAKGCEWNKPWGTAGVLESIAEHRAHVAAMLAPIIREAQAEAWEKGQDSVNLVNNMFGGWLEYTDNPYRSNDE